MGECWWVIIDGRGIVVMVGPERWSERGGAKKNLEGTEAVNRQLIGHSIIRSINQLTDD